MPKMNKYIQVHTEVITPIDIRPVIIKHLRDDHTRHPEAQVIANFQVFPMLTSKTKSKQELTRMSQLKEGFIRLPKSTLEPEFTSNEKQWTTQGHSNNSTTPTNQLCLTK